jgi:TRAP-type C4-dicarboxylate transport system permease small subunit
MYAHQAFELDVLLALLSQRRRRLVQLLLRLLRFGFTL